MDPIQADVETMPRLYRAVLDLVAELEPVEEGHLDVARMRADAIRTYAAGWSPTQERRLRGLYRQLQAAASAHATSPFPRVRSGPPFPRPRGLRPGS